MKLLFAASASALLALASPAQATLIQFQFSGHTNQYLETDPGNVYDAVANGTEVFGSFTFDTASTPLYVNPGSDEYFSLQNFAVTVSGSSLLSFSLQHNPAIQYDTYLYATNNTVGSVATGSATGNPYNYAFFTTNSFSLASLPTASEIPSLLTSGQFNGSTYYDTSTGYTEVGFTVDSITNTSAAPEPTSALFGIALVGTVMTRRWRTNAAPQCAA